MDSQYLRTFIGLPLRVEQPFLHARSNLLKALSEERISWTNPEQYHVTLRFIGDTERSAIKKIGSALHDGIPVPKQISMETGGLGSFGPRKRPRVLWIGFENTVFFDLLKQQVDQVLDLCGIPPEPQEFRAHLTLGRIRSLKNLQRYYLTVDQMKNHFRESVRFDRLVFFQSILGSRGPEYRVLEEVKFPL